MCMCVCVVSRQLLMTIDYRPSVMGGAKLQALAEKLAFLAASAPFLSYARLA